MHLNAQRYFGGDDHCRVGWGSQTPHARREVETGPKHNTGACGASIACALLYMLIRTYSRYALAYLTARGVCVLLRAVLYSVATVSVKGETKKRFHLRRSPAPPGWRCHWSAPIPGTHSQTPLRSPANKHTRAPHKAHTTQHMNHPAFSGVYSLIR